MVADGLEVDTSDGMAFYYAAGFRGSTFEDFGPVQPGDVAQVTVKEDGSTGGTRTGWWRSSIPPPARSSSATSRTRW
jgi:hypothetical protein